MTRLSLTPRELIDLKGVDYRIEEDMRQLGLTYQEAHSLKIPEGFTDLGIVEWEGQQYYASTLTRPVIEVDEDN